MVSLTFHSELKLTPESMIAYIRTGSLDELSKLPPTSKIILLTHTTLAYHANLDIWKSVKLKPHQSHGRNVMNVSVG